MANVATNSGVDDAVVTTVAERRLEAEWALLQQLAALNPTRLAQPRRKNHQFEVMLLETPALLENTTTIQTTHLFRIAYPRFFPAVPLELYLANPVLHPNVHPLTGFVCLWDRHRTSNTVEHALHKAAAILTWQLVNSEPRHVMQQGALELDAKTIAKKLRVLPLNGIEHPAEICEPPLPRMIRRRLS